MFKKKYRVKPGKRYCPSCGKKIDITDVSLCTEQRVWCKTCKRHVWITILYRDHPIPVSQERRDLLAKIVLNETEEHNEIRNSPKTVTIPTHYCTMCGHPITKTVETKYSFIEMTLECPNCGDIRFYE